MNSIQFNNLALYGTTESTSYVGTVEALWTDTLVSGQLYLWLPWQNPVWTLAHTNSVFTHCLKRPAPVADTFSASRGCPLTGALTVAPRSAPSLINTLFPVRDFSWVPKIKLAHQYLLIDSFVARLRGKVEVLRETDRREDTEGETVSIWRCRPWQSGLLLLARKRLYFEWKRNCCIDDCWAGLR